MKKIFPGYYRPTREEFSNLWKSCLFVLDANVLLNLYRYSHETSKELIRILKQISGRLWVPHQAALEYQNNRLETIAKQLDEYDKIIALVEKSKKDLKDGLDSLGKHHPYIKVDILIEIMEKACRKIEKNLKTLKKNHPDLLQHDNLRDVLDILLKDKIGLPYSQEELEDIYKLGKKRYEQEIAPGYKDKKKEGTSKYGDLVMWFQIIDRAKETNKSIILVTDDRKEDWWTRHRGKTIGPKPELISEILSKANAPFYLYQTEPFMENAERFLNMQIKKKAIDEVRGIRIRDEELEQAIYRTSLDTTYLTEAVETIGNMASSVYFSDALKRAMDSVPASIKISEGSALARAISNASPSIKLSEAISSALVGKLAPSIKLSEAISSAIQETKSSLSIPKNDREQSKDDNLSTDFEPKEIDKNEKDNQK